MPQTMRPETKIYAFPFQVCVPRDAARSKVMETRPDIVCFDVTTMLPIPCKMFETRHFSLALHEHSVWMCNSYDVTFTYATPLTHTLKHSYFMINFIKSFHRFVQQQFGLSLAILRSMIHVSHFECNFCSWRNSLRFIFKIVLCTTLVGRLFWV